MGAPVVKLNLSAPPESGQAETVDIPIEAIRVVARRRVLRRDCIAALAESIEALGLRVPISVESATIVEGERPKQVYYLIAGLHRLTACQELGWSTISAIVTKDKELDRQLWEIDENLMRAELSALERAEHLMARKDIYEMLYPETRKGVAQANGMNASLGNKADVADKLSFTSDTASKTGLSDRDVQRSVRRAAKILPEVRETVRSVEAIADSGLELDALAKLEPEKQKAFAADLVAGKVQSARGYQAKTTEPGQKVTKSKPQSWTAPTRKLDDEEIAAQALPIFSKLSRSDLQEIIRIFDPKYNQESGFQILCAILHALAEKIEQDLDQDEATSGVPLH